MKNTTNLKDDGSRWRMLSGSPPEQIFKSWGAMEIYPVPNSTAPLRSGGVFMLRMEDGWHYAHVDGNTSCWCAKETLGELPDGNCAWLAHELRNAKSAVERAELGLANDRDILTDAQNAYAKALHKAKAGKA